MTTPGTSHSGGTGSHPASGPLTVGQQFGARYHIIKLLGAGGMGAVYHAWDEELAVAVAVKVIRPEISEDPEAARELEQRFKRELLLARQVTHKNVVRIHDLGEIAGIKYITMPFIQGADLAQVLKQAGKLPIAAALRIVRQVAAGLQAAHEAGVVHRDLKPANIMIEGDRAVIMDFGIARSVSGATLATVGSTGPRVFGTLEYMAPEQARGELPDHRADIYACGLILYDLLLGPRRTSGRDSAIAGLMSRMQQAPPTPRSLDPTIPEPLDQIVGRCLQPDPAARYQTTAELTAALDQLDPNGDAVKAKRRVTLSVPMAAAVIVLAIVLGVGGWWRTGRRAVPAAPVPRDPVSVLIADFDNRTGDPVFEGSLEQALGLGIEGAAFITSYPRRDAQRLTAQIKPGSKLDEAGARLVAVREGIKLILAGSVQPDGSGYKILVQAIDPSNGNTLATAAASASKKADVLDAVGTLSAKIRGDLGDTSPDSAKIAARETFTTANLEAARTYLLAQDLALGGKDEEAIGHYRKATELDPNFGRAYSGWATSAFKLGRKDEADGLWKKALSLMDRMTEREKYRTLGLYYLSVTRNYEKAIENYAALVTRFPLDGSGHNNLAIAYFNTLNFQKALEEGRALLKIYPRSILYRGNYALYAMYASDFDAAVAEAQRVIAQSPYDKAYLPVAMAALAGGNAEAARAAYESMAKTGTRGESLASMGLADLDMYGGRFAEAEPVLKAGLADDEERKSTAAMAVKYAALAEAYQAMGKTALGIGAIQSALKLNRQEAVMVPAARVLLAVGQEAGTKALAAELRNQLQPRSRAYADIIDAEIALRAGRTTAAIDALLAAKKQADLWLVRFDLGRAYVAAGAYAEAFSELETCQKRRGEATAIFLDEVPSYRYLAPLSYWLARAQQGLGLTADAVANYKAYLALRSESTDPLAADARKRLGSQ